MPLSTQLTLVLSHPICPSLPSGSLPFQGRHIIYSMIECCCLRMEGLIFLTGMLSWSQRCSCIPQVWVTGQGPRQRAAPFCFLCSRHSHSYSRQTRTTQKKTHIESSGTHLLNVKGKEKKQVHEKKVKRAINTLAEDVMLMINALCQCSNLHQCLEVCEGEYNISLSQWCAQTKSRHWILYHSFLLWWRCLLMS